MRFPVFPLFVVCLSAAISVLLGWLVFDFRWALRHAYFGTGIGFFLSLAIGLLANMATGPGDSLIEKIQKRIARGESFKGALTVVKIAVGFVTELAFSLAYWPVRLIGLALVNVANPTKVSDTQNLMRQAAGQQPINLSCLMLAQNLGMLMCMVLFPALRTSDTLRTILIIAMVGNALWLIDIALTPIELRLRLSMLPARAVRMFLMFLLATFLSDAILLYSFRLMFSQSASFAQASLDLVTMGQYNPAIAKLTDDITKSVVDGKWRHAIDSLLTLPVDFMFSWAICALFGTTLASRSIGILMSRSSFRRTEAEKVAGAFTALLSNDMNAALPFISELPKNHYLTTLYAIQTHINDLAFGQALAEVPTLVRRRRQALELDDEVVLSQRERWFVLISHISLLDISMFWVAALLWSTQEEYLCDRDFLYLLNYRLSSHGREELETELHYAVAVAHHQGNRSARIEWLAAKRDFVSNISNLGEITEATAPDQIGQLVFLMSTNQITARGIRNSKAIRSMPKEWDALVLEPLYSVDFADLMRRMVDGFDTAEPLDQVYYLAFLTGVTSAAEGDNSLSETESKIFDEARALVKKNQARVMTRYGDTAQAMELIAGQVMKM